MAKRTNRTRPTRRGTPPSAQLSRPDVPYTMRLRDGRVLYVEVPGRWTATNRSGEVMFTADGVAFLDRVRALAMRTIDSPTPAYLVTLREALGLTQKELGDRIGVNKLTVSRWERGTLRPSDASLAALDGLKREAVRKGVVIAA